MNRVDTAVLTSVALVCLGFVRSAGDGVPQYRTLKEQLIGTWTLVAVETDVKNGVKNPFMEGIDLKGLLIFDGSRFSFQTISEFPKIFANDRLKTTPEESKAVAHGVLSYFGTYSVSEAAKVLTLHIERSSFPNQNGADGTRVVTSITADELHFTNPTTQAGVSNSFVWKRAK
jgi:hypothetical protein